MAEVSLDKAERQRLARLLAGHFRPAHVRPGTWHKLLEGALDDLIETAELKALAKEAPRLLVILKLIEQLEPYVQPGGSRISGGEDP